MRITRQSLSSIIRGRPCTCGSRKFHETPVGKFVVRRTCRECGRSKTVRVKYPPRDEDVELISFDALFACVTDEPGLPKIFRFVGLDAKDEHPRTETARGGSACENAKTRLV